MLEEAPDKFLSKLYLNLEMLKQKGDELAFKIEEKLRIIVSLFWNILFFCLRLVLILLYIACKIFQHCVDIIALNHQFCVLIRLLVVMVRLGGFLELFVT